MRLISIKKMSEAVNKRCPYTAMTYCYGNDCMAWVEMSAEDYDEIADQIATTSSGCFFLPVENASEEYGFCSHPGSGAVGVK